MANHPVCHIEFSANDREAAGKYYAALFGWQVHHHPELGYTTFAVGDGPGGGFAQVGQGTPAGSTRVYVYADDIDATLEKAVSLGGKVLMPKDEIPNTGWLAIFEDPQGNQVGLYKAAQ